MFSTETGELLAIIEASELGRIRTGASSGIATKYLSNGDASSVGIIGTGYQAGPQLDAICKVRRISKVKVFSRNAEKREKFTTKMIKQTNNIHLFWCIMDQQIVFEPNLKVLPFLLLTGVSAHPHPSEGRVNGISSINVTMPRNILK